MMNGTESVADLSDGDRRDILETAAAMADAAREATLLHFRSDGLDAATKEAERFDPVTVADRLAEDRMLAILSVRRPQDGVSGEERGSRAGRSGLTWHLDPIDGTRAYLCGAPSWGVLVALADGAGPIYGLIDQPFIGERFEGGLGRAGVTGPMGARTLRCRPARPLAEAILLSTFPEIGTEAEAAAFRRVAAEVRLTRYGLDCYGYALLAAGQVDLVIEAGLQSYDVMAPIAVVEAAGGLLTDWQGRPAHAGGRVIAAANAAVHAAALERLNAG
jgi:histidinol phosphatase-like enzyme (inositol monophosphatase family)